MKVANLISNIQSITNDIVADGIIIDYINSLESQIFSEEVEEYRVKWIECFDDKDINFGVFKYEIEKAEVYDKKDGQLLDTINLLDSSENINYFTDLPVQSENYSIANKWGHCFIKILFRYVPDEKTLENSTTDDLEIMRYGRQWLDLYEHYLKHKIFFAVEEYAQSNNEAILFNEVLSRFRKYVYEHRFNRGVKINDDRWKA